MPTTNTPAPKQELNAGKRAFGFMRSSATQGLQTFQSSPQPNIQAKKVATRTTPSAKTATKNYVFAQYVQILLSL